MKKILLVLVCSLFAFETVSAQGKNAVGLRLGDGVEFLYQCDLSSRNFCNSRWRLLILKGCPLRESIIGAAAGGIGHPRLAIGIWMSVWVEPWDFMTLTIRVFARCGRLLRFRLSFQKCPDLFGGRLPSCDRSLWSAVDMTASLIPDSGISDCPSNSIFETMNDRYIFLIAV